MPARKRTTGRRSAAKLSRQAFRDRFDGIVSNIGKVIKGKDDIIRLSLTALIGNGHILFEDMPGTGKTMLARSIAQSVNAESSRIQCTPDLLPADITGSPVLDRKTGDFVFRQGPVFANVFLADEINRASPKTQAALLESMAERNVTMDGVTHHLPNPFFVLATQNPIELAGTFPLPEAQLDRFLFKLSVGYLDTESELDVLDTNRKAHSIESLSAIVETEEVLAMMDWATEVSVSDPVKRYIVELVQATRSEPALLVGASTRATMALHHAARVLAASQGRDDVIPDDVKSLAMAVLAHRVILTPDALIREDTVEGVVERIITRIKVPTGVKRGGGAGSAREPAGESVAATA